MAAGVVSRDNRRRDRRRRHGRWKGAICRSEGVKKVEEVAEMEGQTYKHGGRWPLLRVITLHTSESDKLMNLPKIGDLMKSRATTKHKTLKDIFCIYLF